MKRYKFPLMLAAVLAAFSATLFCLSPAPAATDVGAGFTFLAGAGGVTAKTVVYITAAGTVTTATGDSQALIGVCELTAAANVMTRVAMPGTTTTVTSTAAAIAVGDFVTSGAAGAAVKCDNANAGTHRYVGIALTAVGAGGGELTILIWPGALTKTAA